MGKSTTKENNHKYYLKHRETLLLKAKEYYEEHSGIIKARTREWYQTHKDDPEFKKKTGEAIRRYYLANRDAKLLESKNRWLKNRLTLLEYFGGKCEKCGFSDYRALQIDHVNGGGVRELRQLKSLKAPLKYLERIKLNRNEYQLLCANCNWIKRYENQENVQKRINK